MEKKTVSLWIFRMRRSGDGGGGGGDGGGRGGEGGARGGGGRAKWMSETKRFQ